jgi:uncharacterized membrane protein
VAAREAVVPWLGEETMSTSDDSDRESVFLRTRSAGPRGILLILVGVGGLCLAVVGFVLAVRGRAGQIALHTMSTFPTILSIGALTAGWRILRSPSRVAIGRDGLTVETRQSVRHFHWEDVGHAASVTGGMSHRRSLNVTDVNGKSLVKLDESFNGFDDMVAMVSGYVDAKGDDTALQILRKKARRNGAMAFVVGLLLLSAAVFIGWDAHENQRVARLLNEEGQLGKAEVVRRFVAPNGVTKRIEYRTKGSKARNVEVDPRYWDSLAGVRTVPVIYVPSEPGISRLVRGEVKENDVTKTPAGGYGLAAMGGAIALFLLGMSPFMWNGWDLAHDSKTQKWSLKRFGKVVWSSRGKPNTLPDCWAEDS